MRQFAEHAGAEFEARFESVPGVPAVPFSAHWRLRCVTNDRTLVDWTEATPEVLTGAAGEMVGVRVLIDVPGALNALIGSGNRREVKELQIMAAKDTEREYTEVLQYAVVPISGGR